MSRTLTGLVALISLASTQSLQAAIYGPAFAGSYTDISLGGPVGVPGPLGGLTLLAGDPNTLLIGGDANNAFGAIYSVGLVRGAGGHITGFAGPASLYATAPNIDGGLAYGPGGVLLYTAYPTHEIGQIKPGSVAPDRVDGVTGIGSSVGALTFVPAGFSGAGQLKVVSFSSGEFGTATFAPDGSGTFDIDPVIPVTTIVGGPEGIAYVAAGNPGFAVDSMLVAEWSIGRVAAYEIDGNGDPIAATRRDFITNLSGAEGAFIDPITGDFLFSTFGGGDQVIVVQGFRAPPGAVPEAASLLVWAGLGVCGAAIGLSRKLPMGTPAR
ncbi:MAG: hypothetical protein DCC67_14765 [Planctomycetota bacterium]|nr:MAG: hypothetical protein DCC67_14765 [Planctomycetota bacterium]